MGYTLLLYLGLMGLGILIGSKRMKSDQEYKWLGKLQLFSLIVLIVALGVQIGADDKVISSLKEIGVSAFIVTAFAMAGSVFCLYWVRKWMKLNKEGVKEDD